MARASRWLAVLVLCLPGVAGADIEGKLNLYETEAKQIADTLPRPNQTSNTQQQRRLVDAEVAFALGDYDTASLMLFDLASRPGAEQEAALYYLGESLFQKGDRGAARSYYAQVITRPGGKYYQPSLIRLVEIAIAQQDTADVDQHLAALDRLSSTRVPQVTYLKGKYAFSQGKFDDAIAQFRDVAPGSTHELQSMYYLGTSAVAKQDLARATEVFTELIGKRPRTSNDRRVVELAQLALGRVYYERDQPSKAIDAYLLVDRHSDLFSDALYEVAWVYVKGKQYDRALRALELLALSDPTSNKTATVRILEGNLRIRKAQLIRQAQIVGTVDADKEAPETEYDKAAKVFRETHTAYFPSYRALEIMLAGGGDPADYLAQLAGRQTQVFQAAPPIPEAAAQYLRDEPDVSRAVANQVDLGTITSHLSEAEATIARLEVVLSANDRTVVYPALASRRARIGAIQGELNAIRGELADQQLALVDSNGGLAQATANRRALAQQAASMGDPEEAAVARVAEVRAGYDKIDDGAGEAAGALDTTLATAVALRKYVNDPPAEGATPVADEQKTTINTELVATAAEAYAIQKELEDVRRELTLGRDLAGVKDEAAEAARDVRRRLKLAHDEEARLLAGFASASRDAGRTRSLGALADRATRISQNLGQTEQLINNVVDQAMAQAKAQLAQERSNVDAYKTELAELEIESRAVGGTILGASFQNVKSRFYDVIVRTDVGSIDVSWSQKEDADDDLKRLNLSRARDLKQLQDEFKDILDSVTPGGPAAPPPTPAPAPAAAGSPDKGEGARVSPGAGQPSGPAAPTVRPDNEVKPAPKGGSR